ncbi:murein L,D-transpeptidase family protein [Jannaschia sp. W003]|uniref:L,D-transpeptidase family protein n=1 Tax=Jannaschia sp. W003 TaxID=2867012 RepID=UPI0021A6670A|nr:L,D-transpeptidase family protein [Jannaschia sp. W003]UWQ22049.1 L,D-transpeptidase family protein [Jannaschia sp. W003]
MNGQYTRRGALGIGAGAAAMLAGCGTPKFATYRGPAVTKLEVHKSSRRMYLLNGKTVLKTVGIQLGFAPQGHKRVYGDGRTPEGRYMVDRRNPNSSYFLSVGINYPNAADVAWAAERGLNPGGDIFVHGWGPEPRARHGHDWTAGCVACTDQEMRDVYAMVRDGTIIDIFA